jgi:hypothetical protein
MNRFKLQAYVQEFQFLMEIVGDEIPDSVRVKRADENLLKVVPECYYHDGSMGVSKMDERVHFVLADGSILHDAVEQGGKKTSNYAYSQEQSWEGETVLEAIDRHGVADQLQYIVQDVFDLDDWEGQEYHRSWEIVIYKAPKGTSFGAEIEKARAQALAEVRAEADF